MCSYPQAKSRLIRVCAAFIFTLFRICTAASADEFHWQYGSPNPEKFFVLPGNHSFQIDGIPTNARTEWSISNYWELCENYGWTEVHTEVDQSGPTAVAPLVSFDFTYNNRQPWEVVATVFDQSDAVTDVVRWKFWVSGPDLVIIANSPHGITTSPSQVRTGEPFTITARVWNIGAFIASAGPDADQEVHYYIDDEFVGSATYDDVIGEPAFVESPPITLFEPGTHMIRAVSDATNTVYEYSLEDNNDLVEIITVESAPLTVPNVIGMRRAAARRTLKSAGFVINELKVTNKQNLPHKKIVKQDPNPGTEVNPEDNGVSLTLNFKPAPH